MRLRRSIQNSIDGFTVLELLVSATLGLLVLALALSATLSNRQTFHDDLVRARVIRNIRSSLDIIAPDVREAGENLPPHFPAVIVQDGGTGASDTLIIRRNLLDEVLKLCQAITAGSTNTDIFFAIPGTLEGCVYSSAPTNNDKLHNFNAWAAFRTSNGGSVKAYAYNSSSKVGEFFDYIAETDDGSSFKIVRSPGTWTNDYPIGPSAIYIIEEWQFQLSTSIPNENMLQLVENQEVAQPKNVAADITDFQVKIVLDDSSELDAFDGSLPWTRIRGVRVDIQAQGSSRNGLITRSLTGQYFPRNILSN